jgi:hypothetical protein
LRPLIQAQLLRADRVTSDKFLKAIEKSSIVETIVNWAKFKQDEQLKRKGGSKRTKVLGITKLDDANCAGKKPLSRGHIVNSA